MAAFQRDIALLCAAKERADQKLQQALSELAECHGIGCSCYRLDPCEGEITDISDNPDWSGGL